MNGANANGALNTTSTPEAAPSKKFTHETITPHKLTVAVLIRSYCQFRDSDDFKCLEDQSLKAKYRRDFSVLVLKLLQNPDISLLELENILTSSTLQLHSSVVYSFVETITQIFKVGTGAMLDVIDSLGPLMPLPDSLAPASGFSVSKSSVIGYFLRRLIVNFDKLTFSEVTSVYLTFKNYAKDIQKDRSLVIDASVEVDKLMHADDWSANRHQWSRRQAELFVATQASLLANNPEKALPPPELQNRITNLLKSNPSLSEAHFLSYLNYLRVNEFCGAMDSLYHCFDRKSLGESKSSTDDKSKVYRFATLNLAILHYHFGHIDEALICLKQAISTSQAATDEVCLQHSLSWLYKLTGLNKEQLMEHSVATTHKMDLSQIASLGVQTFILHACSIAGDPLKMFENLTKGDLVNCLNNIGDLIPSSYAIRSALWQFYGKSEMSSLWSQLSFYLNIDNTNHTKTFYGESFCLSICNVANHLLLQGDYALVNTILNFAKSRFPYEPNSHLWMICENISMFTRALHLENWAEAESAAQKLLVLDKWEGYLRLVELSLYKEDYPEAHKLIRILLENCRGENNRELHMHYYVRSKILLAEVQFATCFPDKVPAGIMTLLNECLVETNKHHMQYFTALIYLHTANVQLSLGLTTQALRLLDRCLVQIMAHGGRYDRARALLLYVKCMVAHSAQLPDDEKKDAIEEYAKMLNGIRGDFVAVEAMSRVKDVLFLQAHLYNSINMQAERNKCALDFRLLEEERKTKNYSTLAKVL